MVSVCISVLVLIGNKADLEDQKQVDENEARTLAENLGLKYFETSAFNGQNVSKSVEALLDQVRLWLLIKTLIDRVVKSSWLLANFSIFFMISAGFSVPATFSCLTPAIKPPMCTSKLCATLLLSNHNKKKKYKLLTLHINFLTCND